MKKSKQITIFSKLLSIIINPIFILVYWISFYELYTLCRFGRVDHNITILFICMLFFLACIIYLIVAVRKKNMISPQYPTDDYTFDENSKRKWSKSSLKTIWTYIAIIIMVIITVFYGAKIYHSATNFRGKLSWVLHDLGHKKENKT